MPAPVMPRQNVVTGIALAAAGYACFSFQDAAVKWLVADYPVTQVLFLRSVIVFAVSMLAARLAGAAPFWRSASLNWLVLRAVLVLVAWISYYFAARSLGLAEMTTLYFVAPIIVVGLSIFVLRETVTPARWLAVFGGFAGVLIVADPGGRGNLTAVLLVLLAAFLWAWSVILVRLVNRGDSTFSVMAVSSLFFLVACGVLQPFVWRTPDAMAWAVIVAFSLMSAVGQYLIYEAFRYAPASVLAPVEYTGIVWAFGLGYLIWRDVPTAQVTLGAAVIIAASLGLVWWERRSEARGDKGQE